MCWFLLRCRKCSLLQLLCLLLGLVGAAGAGPMTCYVHVSSSASEQVLWLTRRSDLQLYLRTSFTPLPSSSWVANFVWKGPDDKYFQPYGPNSLYCNASTLHRGVKSATVEWARCAPTKLYFQKHAVGQIWAPACGLPTLATGEPSYLLTPVRRRRTPEHVNVSTSYSSKPSLPSVVLLLLQGTNPLPVIEVYLSRPIWSVNQIESLVSKNLDSGKHCLDLAPSSAVY